MDYAVEIRNLSYRIPSKEILRDVDLYARKNQFVGLIGPNGSGKTTILRHIYRALPVESRCVMINGQDLKAMSFRSAAREVTVMRQENSSDFDYSILEMVLMGRSPHRKFYERDTEEDVSIARSALRFMGMEEQADQSFSTLSGGEKQRVLIARSLAQEADILVLDEPTNHLDVYYQWRLMEIISALQKTVIAVFHELNLACAFCDVLYVLHEGRIVQKGTPKDVITKELLSDVFKVRADVLMQKNGRPYILYQGSDQRNKD